MNRLWGKIPNVIEQRLMVALYQAGRAMTHAEILDLAKSLGLMNVSMNLSALKDKGLVAENVKSAMHLTHAGLALTEVGLQHNLFATPQELAALVNKPKSESESESEPEPEPSPPPVKPTATKPMAKPAANPPITTVKHDTPEEKAAQRLWHRETSRAESSRLAESPQLASVLSTPITSSPEPRTATVTPLRAVATSTATAPLVILPQPVIAEKPKPAVEPPKPVAPIQDTKPKPVVSTSKPPVKPVPTSVRRPLPPPPPKFRKP